MRGWTQVASQRIGAAFLARTRTALLAVTVLATVFILLIEQATIAASRGVLNKGLEGFSAAVASIFVGEWMGGWAKLTY